MQRAIRNIACVFNGQGSQYVGMGQDLRATWPHVMVEIDEGMNEAVGEDLSSMLQLSSSSSETALAKPSRAQPAILAHSVAVWKILEKETEWPHSPNHMVPCVLGHSLGEYSALVVAGSLDFYQAMQLVTFRGKVMEEAMNLYSDGSTKGSMAALWPMTYSEAREAVHRASEVTHQVCNVANVNSSKQIVISGDATAVQEAVDIAKKYMRVRRAIYLNVGAPFHSKLMQHAAERLAEKLKDVDIHAPRIPVISNVSGVSMSLKPDEIRRSLVDQVTATVQWQRSVKHGIETYNVQDILEFGPRQVLSNLIRHDHPVAPICRSLDMAQAIRDFIDIINAPSSDM